MEKSIKDLAKEAKKRMKSGFWEKYGKEVNGFKDRIKSQGVRQANIVDYYQNIVTQSYQNNTDDNELFYSKVKDILINYGEVSDMIDRLIDKDYYLSLSYDKRQRYIFELSNRYRQCLQRYKQEKVLN